MIQQRSQHLCGLGNKLQARESAREPVIWTTNSTDMSVSKLPEMVKDREARHAAVHGVAKSQTWLGNLNNNIHILSKCKNSVTVYDITW